MGFETVTEHFDTLTCPREHSPSFGLKGWDTTDWKISSWATLHARISAMRSAASSPSVARCRRHPTAHLLSGLGECPWMPTDPPGE